MPFILFVVGLALVISAVRGKQDDLLALVKGDFIGSGSFAPWLVSLFVIGGLGYIKPIKPITDAFLVLVIVVLFLSNGGFFAKFVQQTGIGNGAIGGTSSIPSLPSLPQLPSLS